MAVEESTCFSVLQYSGCCRAERRTVEEALLPRTLHLDLSRVKHYNEGKASPILHLPIPSLQQEPYYALFILLVIVDVTSCCRFMRL